MTPKPETCYVFTGNTIYTSGRTGGTKKIIREDEPLRAAPTWVHCASLRTACPLVACVSVVGNTVVLSVDTAFCSFGFVQCHHDAVVGKSCSWASPGDGSMILSQPVDLASAELMECVLCL